MNIFFQEMVRTILFNLALILCKQLLVAVPHTILKFRTEHGCTPNCNIACTGFLLLHIHASDRIYQMCFRQLQRQLLYKVRPGDFLSKYTPKYLIEVALSIMF